MRKNFLAKSYPPPEKLSYQHKIRVWAIALLFAFVFALSGCTNSTALNTATYRETVDGILWEVEYNTETGAVVSAETPLAIIEFDIYSPFYKFMAEYTSNPNVELIRSTTLSAKPISAYIYKIEQVEKYTMGCSFADYEIIKETFPSCVYTESPYSYEVIDNNTGEISTINAIAKEITFASSVTTYEQKIIFTVPALGAEG